MKMPFLTVALAVFVGLLASCDSPCRELADYICNCQSTRAKRESCRNSIAAADSNIDPSDEEEDACQRILDSGRCTCQALAAGEYAACGLAANPLD